MSNPTQREGALHVVAVPIGNLEDITLRALRLLKSADRIACEDTRRTGKLLELLGVARPPLMAVHDHNEAERAPAIIRALEAGEQVVLVSDAGTPGVSDPGYRVIKAVIEAGHRVIPIPGPSAAITALCASGLPTDVFRFVGFLSSKSTARRRAMEALAGAEETLIFYVGPHHLQAFLKDAAQCFGADRPGVIARELTKQYETFKRGGLQALADEPGVMRGEVVILIGGAPEEGPADEATLEAAVRALLSEGYPTSKAAKMAAKRTGVTRDEAYRMAMKIRSEE
ncbi:MAG: 16S rRNA (cytidine(1402)-2'-O)-methyltransferase [Bradymonadia bacterium]